MMTDPPVVIPANEGIQGWIPVCTGMTREWYRR